MKNTAGEGHWQHGRIERMIRTLKGVIARTAESYEPGAVSSQELIDSCLNARNQLSRVRGAPPVMLALGRMPRPPIDYNEDSDSPAAIVAEGLGEEFAASLALKYQAQAAYLEQAAKSASPASSTPEHEWRLDHSCRASASMSGAATRSRKDGPCRTRASGEGPAL